MGRLGTKLRSVCDYQVAFWCPGCKMSHVVGIAPPGAYSSNFVWSYNDNPDAPTFHPSVMTWWEDNGVRRDVCHSWVKEGRIEFLADSMHALAGQTVDLPDFPDGR
jgi:hypothetical protein